MGIKVCSIKDMNATDNCFETLLTLRHRSSLPQWLNHWAMVYTVWVAILEFESQVLQITRSCEIIGTYAEINILGRQCEAQSLRSHVGMGSESTDCLVEQLNKI